jgi:hypothetical protein
VYKEYFKLIELLINKGHTLNVVNSKGVSPLMFWVQKRHLENSEKLLQMNADPNL